MPHVTVKFWPGKSQQQKARIAEAIARDVLGEMGLEGISHSGKTYLGHP